MSKDNYGRLVLFSKVAGDPLDKTGIFIDFIHDYKIAVIEELNQGTIIQIPVEQMRFIGNPKL